MAYHGDCSREVLSCNNKAITSISFPHNDCPSYMAGPAFLMDPSPFKLVTSSLYLQAAAIKNSLPHLLALVHTVGTLRSRAGGHTCPEGLDKAVY